jgi:hypothetical protein
MKIQLNHRGHQKPFVIGNGYIMVGDAIIREWNNGDHCRKFIHNGGIYLEDINDLNPKRSDLYFWGEWEGNSFFEPILNSGDARILPNGIHEPFHSTANKGTQNTDPYVYGNDFFKYCICKQTGILCDLAPNSLIVFGTVFPSLNKFYIDTVFVINTNEKSVDVHASRAAGYSQIYGEETLEQLPQYLGIPYTPSNNRLYHSKTWWDNKENKKKYFSFVPCKLTHNGHGFERLYLYLNDPIFNLSRYPSGKSYLRNCKLPPMDLWYEIVNKAKEQKFKLGIRFDEPNYSKMIDGLLEN